MRLKLFLLLISGTQSVVYRGVRYAEPPQRWQPPVEYQLGFDHALANLESYDACPQGDAAQSEDCLFLDIFKELSHYFGI